MMKKRRIKKKLPVAEAFASIGHPLLELRAQEGVAIGQDPEMLRATATMKAGRL